MKDKYERLQEEQEQNMANEDKENQNTGHLKSLIKDFLDSQGEYDPLQKKMDQSNLEDYFSHTDENNVYGDYTDERTEELAKRLKVFARKRNISSIINEDE